MTAPIFPETPAWMSQALCAQVDPDLWFQEKGGSSRPAKRVCAACPVADECLQRALDNEETWGIFGGLTYTERRALRRNAA